MSDKNRSDSKMSKRDQVKEFIRQGKKKKKRASEAIDQFSSSSSSDSSDEERARLRGRVDKVRKQLNEKSKELLDLKGKTDSKIEEMTEQAKLDTLEIENQKQRIKSLLNDVREKEGRLNLKEQELNNMKDELTEYKNQISSLNSKGMSQLKVRAWTQFGWKK